MKKIILLLLLTAIYKGYAQPMPDARRLFGQGADYLYGVFRNHNPPAAKALLIRSAAMGCAEAMHLLARMYTGMACVRANTDSALYWYRMAMQEKYSRSFYNTGHLYTSGKLVQQDFAAAARYFSEGAQLGDADCKNALAYMYYKGFGIAQHYGKAFALFSETALQGNTNSMYFLGLCYRNGYGTPVDTVQAMQWLHKAAKLYDRQAIDELAEPLPENISTVLPEVMDQLNGLKKYTEKFTAADDNDFTGSYEGYAVYYDWSGRHVSEIVPLRLELEKTAAGYNAVWTEGNIAPANVMIQAKGNQLVFGKNSNYIRKNHYSYDRPEQWQFNDASLRAGYADGFVRLNGYVQFYSSLRREPGKPLEVILKKTITILPGFTGAGVSLLVFPNPAGNHTTVKFVLPQSAGVAIRLSGQDGNVHFTEKPRVLPAGSYTYPLPVAGLPAGIYNVQLIINGNANAITQLIKQ